MEEKEEEETTHISREIVEIKVRNFTVVRRSLPRSCMQARLNEMSRAVTLQTQPAGRVLGK